MVKLKFLLFFMSFLLTTYLGGNSDYVITTIKKPVPQITKNKKVRFISVVFRFTLRF